MKPCTEPGGTEHVRHCQHDTYACADCGREFTDGHARDDHFMSSACPDHGLTRRQQQRRHWLVKFFNQQGWLNCSHKSLERLETEFAAKSAVVNPKS